MLWPFLGYVAAALVIAAPHVWLAGALSRSDLAPRSARTAWLALFGVLSAAGIVAAYRIGGAAGGWTAYLVLGVIAIACSMVTLRGVAERSTSVRA